MSQVKVTVRSRLSGRALKEQWTEAGQGTPHLENEVVFVTRAYATMTRMETLDYTFITFTIKQNTIDAFNAMHPRVFFRDVTHDDIYLEVTRGWHELRRLPNPEEPANAEPD